MLITEGAEKVTGANEMGQGFAEELVFGFWSLVFGLGSWILDWILHTERCRSTSKQRPKTKGLKPKAQSSIVEFFVELSRRARIELLQDSILLHRRVFVIRQ